VRRLVLILVLLPLTAHAQEPQDPDIPSLLSQVPAVPGISARLRGLNAGITLTSVHDSSAGWYTLINPAASYSFAHRFSVDLSIPVYLYRLAETETTTITGPPPAPGQPPPQQTTTTTLQPHTWDPGDLVLAAHANLAKNNFRYIVTPSLTLPSGDTDTGLSTGRVTFDFDNHLELSTSRLSYLLDIGAGDSSSLFNRLVTRDYTTLGPLAHFQLGLLVPLAFRSSFQSVAYEQLPLGDNKIYTTLTRPGFPDQTVVSGRSVSEDNGFTNSLAIPFTRHLNLQGYYNRSLRLHLDTVAMGISWVARAQPREKKPTRSLLNGLKQK